MKPKNLFFLFGVVIVQCLSSFSLFAETDSVTNNGNVTAQLEYKTPNTPFQRITLNPGETKKLPKGIQNVRLSSGVEKGAALMKPGQEIDIKISTGKQMIGRLKYYGEKVSFDIKPVSANITPGKTSKKSSGQTKAAVTSKTSEQPKIVKK